MFEFASLSQGIAHKTIAAYAAVLALGGAAGGYAIHEHHAAQKLATANTEMSAALDTTRHELSDLTAKVNTLALRSEAAPPASIPSAQPAADRRPAAVHRQGADPRYKKLQSEIDAQTKAIEQTRGELAGTQGDLVNTRTELSGSIAHTHDELVLLEKKGERSYTEFDLPKAKQFKREGPLEVRLKKANSKHQFADLELMVNDRNLSQKHVNLYQPVMFSTPDSPQPVEVVINDIGKDHIHGYVSASRYRQSDLAALSNPAENGVNPPQGQADSKEQAEPRKKLQAPQ